MCRQAYEFEKPMLGVKQKTSYGGKSLAKIKLYRANT